MSIEQFFGALQSYPILWGAVALALGVILVNGWTDAPNAIATCVMTRALRPRAAILLAAVFNLLGVLVMTSLVPKVACTILGMVDFGGNDRQAMLALLAAMVAIVAWAVAAWVFGIPTSESHALIAGLSGSAIALHGGLGGIRTAEWSKVLFGLVGSVAVGFALGYCATRLVRYLCRQAERGRANRLFGYGQVATAAGMAFMHRAQDGQKFMGIFLLAIALTNGGARDSFTIPLWLMLLCSVVMALGTCLGGKRIIKAVGQDMVRLERYQSFAADFSAGVALLACSLLGLPVSTTHAKTTALLGAGAAKSVRSVDWRVARDMVLTWVLTFPGCGLVGFGFTKLFLWLGR